MTAVVLQTSWPDAVMALGGVAMITIISAVAIWQILASWRARMSIAREDAYRTLAAESLVAQQQAGQSLERTATRLDDLERRTAEIERLLREVG